MKIGILTLPLHTNYGGVLQAFALSEYLKSKGNEVFLIDSDHKKPDNVVENLNKFSRRIINKFIFFKDVEVFSEKRKKSEYNVVAQNFVSFISKHFTNVLHLDKHLDLIDNLDAIIVGSDQIWRPKYYYKIENSFFGFLSNDSKVRRIAYAPSFGTDIWEYTEEQKEKCGDLLRKFHSVSVREDSGVRMVKDFFNVDSTHVIDPTMLLNADVYIEVIENSRIEKSKGTLLNYILDETSEKNSLIKKIEDEKSLVSFRVNARINDFHASVKERIQPPIEQWLRGFYDAKFVVTDSFHACVFSILFNKPFLVIGNKSRGMARFESLLKMFKLEDRLVSSVDDYQIKEGSEIEWDIVNQILESMREKSFDFLKNCLK